ncbi:unnamed protein product [Schistosoma mattheei]|uniref:Uncharacterized protein n=2 Tax=Schistosoma TaxID=6181 RepID=A0A183KID9_9TREM|nr:unnamed protein product [Schistosoma curassoni]VDP66724.1 unnamed protein product [Schistosoma mattheei]
MTHPLSFFGSLSVLKIGISRTGSTGSSLVPECL